MSEIDKIIDEISKYAEVTAANQNNHAVMEVVSIAKELLKAGGEKNEMGQLLLLTANAMTYGKIAVSLAVTHMRSFLPRLQNAVEVKWEPPRT